VVEQEEIEEGGEEAARGFPLEVRKAVVSWDEVDEFIRKMSIEGFQVMGLSLREWKLSEDPTPSSVALILVRQDMTLAEVMLEKVRKEIEKEVERIGQEAGYIGTEGDLHDPTTGLNEEEF